jgi:hypothetical protein
MTSPTKRRAPSATELVLVDGLLTVLYRRMTAALDLGLVLLLEPSTEKYEAFLSEHVAAPMRAAGLVLRLVVAEAFAAPARTPFEVIQVETEKFVGALAGLSGFASVPEAVLEDAVGGVAGSARRLREALLDVAERLGIEPAIAAGATPDREEFYQEILHRLYADLLAERKGRGL